MARKIRHCENCGADLDGPVDKYPGDFITCGKRECEREARDQQQAARDEAHEQLDRDMGYGNY
jgi:hypothetical protein